MTSPQAPALRKIANLPKLRLRLEPEAPPPPALETPPPAPAAEPPPPRERDPLWRRFDPRAETWAEWMKRLDEAELFRPWPAVLAVARPLPWALGTFDALLERLNLAVCDARRLHVLVTRIAGSSVYIHALAAPGSMRHDLDGKPCEPVSEEHRDSARQRLEARRAKWKA